MTLNELARRLSWVCEGEGVHNELPITDVQWDEIEDSYQFQIGEAFFTIITKRTPMK
jgi:hypothetical protein